MSHDEMVAHLRKHGFTARKKQGVVTVQHEGVWVMVLPTSDGEYWQAPDYHFYAAEVLPAKLATVLDKLLYIPPSFRQED